MQNGKIAQAGTFEELLEQNIGFEVLVGAHNQALDSVLTVETSSRITGYAAVDNETETDITPNQEFPHTKQVSEENLRTVKGGALVPIILIAHSSFQMLQIASNYWMAWACPTGDDKAVTMMHYVLLVYTLLAVGSSLCVLLRASLVAIAGLLTSEKLYSNMLSSIFRAPMAFFDSTPSGRILNRQSASTARELARLSGIERAPILHHFAESLSGAATIRAFEQKDRFIDANLCLIDNYSRPWFHNVSALEWISFRLNQLANVVFAFSLVLLVTLPCK